MLTWDEIKKLDRAEIEKKIAELKKDYFEKRQKLQRGEQKDISEFKKLKKTVARLLTFAHTLPPAEIKVKKVEAPAEKKPAVKTEKIEKTEKAEKKVKEKRETKKVVKVEKKAVKKPVKKVVKKEKSK
jgi:ribosomal protein L29